ncbi:2-dehydro-3-deoxy-D-gluconate 5-dehydrogenase [Planctomycetes bacterium Pan216]|uniref:2-dehydro-3-deoxy-D-gluconate 5-dehydrogenase n=1 Tax=Kolteria novifilia TaxID=2527975 RepID=A0A518B898_9BACT|nr:2-dehydro-3-deoxy-D-gluconate 5-dehydrogenase [Planctomycetes bacterium Pan216]
MANYVERHSLIGKRALVTGASRGLGAQIATLFAEAGADVALVARDEEGLHQTKATVEAGGRQALVIAADLGTTEGPREAASTALEHFGAIDILVNNAGIVHLESLREATIDHWDETMAINLRAPFLLARELAPRMIEQGSGKIVSISSVAGVRGLPNHGAYCASKGGLQMLNAVMVAEWSRHNIQANVIAPTVVMTDMGKQVWSDPAKSGPMLDRIPMGRFGEPVEIADLALFLASPASDFVCGQVIEIDGGITQTLGNAT